jgi:hypothetical protein
MWFAARAYVPVSLVYLYKKGVFEDKVSPRELKSIGKIVLMMYLISLSGYGMLRYYAGPIIAEKVGVSDIELAKKAKNDYLIQRDYFMSKSGNKK